MVTVETHSWAIFSVMILAAVSFTESREAETSLIQGEDGVGV